MILSDSEKVSRADPLDLILMGTKYGTKTIFAEDLAKSILQLAGKDSEEGNGSAREAYFALLDGVADLALRKNTFRGKYLGDNVTEEQYEMIADGSFRGLFVGDYWVINGYIWRIADFDYWYRTGSSGKVVMKHHLLIFPDSVLAQEKMNETATTVGGISATIPYRENGTLSKILNDIVIPVFGNDHLLYFEEWYPNAISSTGVPNGGVAPYTRIVIPKETMIFNTRNNSCMPAGNSVLPYNDNLGHEQLALLRIHPYYITFRQTAYWLADIFSSNAFAAVHPYGRATIYSANQDGVGIRPVFGIYG